ncbi:HEXXH motif-containing putative peptide modification protein [Lentzea sp. NPDC005914]|uniref:aKG-HExxH-type peptide beta-hydroxylase n=1 Tax=Lentzea sp. NPDC005914 TaxID=3154572 RepID=UPI0033C1D853
MAAPASTHALHAALSPASELVDDRRALYRLALELFAPGFELSDNLADHPIVRYEIGRALAGHDGLDPVRLKEVAAMSVRDAGVPVAADPAAAEMLEAPLRIVAPAGVRPQPLTEADGERFETVLLIVAEGVRLFRALAPAMADDLLAHVSMLAVMKKETSGGVVSASSRYVPGIVLIDEPSLPMEVAEALVHEGAHEKFFDLAITKEFLDARAEDADYFENSWSGARWPLEQTFAAWHAYSCLAQFFLSIGTEQLGPDSLLPNAKQRAAEIGEWLLAHERDLQGHARWLLHALMGDTGGHVGGQVVPSGVDGVAPSPKISQHWEFHVLPDVRYKCSATGRVVAGRSTNPPEIYWLDEDASWALTNSCQVGKFATFERAVLRATEEWQVGSAVARHRLENALDWLLSAQLIGRTDPEKEL